MKNNDIIDKLMKSPSTKRLGLKKESIIDILQVYDDIVLNTLLENGNLSLSNGMTLEVVKLLDRVHVLRGVSYKSSRKYKLKLTMEDKLYNKIEEYYDNLQKEIL